MSSLSYTTFSKKSLLPGAILVLLVSVFILIPCPGIAQTPNWQALLAGQILVESQEHSDGLPGVRASFTVTAPRERIWTTLIDYPNFPRIFPNIKEIRVLSEDKKGARLEYQVNGIVGTYSYVLSRLYEKPGQHLTWTRLSGDLKRIEGSWEIRDTPQSGVYLLIYEIYVDINSFIPQSMVRSEVMRQTHDMGERLRAWIEGRPLPGTNGATQAERKESP